MADMSFYQLMKMRGVNFSREAFDEETEAQLFRARGLRTIRDAQGTVIGFSDENENALTHSLAATVNA